MSLTLTRFPVPKKITSQKNKSAFVFLDLTSLFQIHIDIPRTNPLIPLFQQPLVQEVREALNVLGPSSPVVPCVQIWSCGACRARSWAVSPALLNKSRGQVELWEVEGLTQSLTAPW